MLPMGRKSPLSELCTLASQRNACSPRSNAGFWPLVRPLRIKAVTNLGLGLGEYSGRSGEVARDFAGERGAELI